jgi:hypothetical protein
MYYGTLILHMMYAINVLDDGDHDLSSALNMLVVRSHEAERDGK